MQDPYKQHTKKGTSNLLWKSCIILFQKSVFMRSYICLCIF